MPEITERKVLRKKLEYLPVLFLHVNRISEYIKDMNQSRYRDILKLKRLIDNLEADLKYHMSQKATDRMGDLKKVNEELAGMDILRNEDNYMDLLIKKQGELINLAGICGLLPDYVDGMPIYER